MALLEDPEFTRMRVKLAKKGFSQNEITQIFESVSSPSDIFNVKKICDKCIQILSDSMNGNNETFGLLKELVTCMAENQKQFCHIINIHAEKVKGKWKYSVQVF